MRFAYMLVAISLALIGVSSPARASQPSARALEATLLAPCCYGGTLDIHDSDLARDLRKEIEDRVRRGESTDSIESDLVARYGPRIRAMPNPGAFSMTVTGAMGLILAGAVALGLLVRRWQRNNATYEAPVPATPSDAYDERLDAELRELE